MKTLICLLLLFMFLQKQGEVHCISFDVQTKTYPWALLDEKAPDFTLTDEQGHLCELNNFIGKWCIILFLPEDDHQQQFKHLRYLTEVYDWLRCYNVEIIWLSSYSESALEATKNHSSIPFITLSDNQRHVSHQYDISSGIHETYTTLIVDKTGIVRAVITDATAECHVLKTLLFFIHMKKAQQMQ